ncbi:Formylglycine-generating sulfatase enzyme [compost metagenome]
MPELPTDTKETDPMINVSFEDTESYCRWLKRKTGKEYSVPTEAEWEFASKGASSSIPKGLETQPEVGYKEIIVDNDLILRSNGLVWEWVQDIYLDKDRVKYSPRNQRVVRKGTTGKKSANNQPYLRKGIFQDSTKVDVGFRVVERPIRKYKLFTNDSLKLR